MLRGMGVSPGIAIGPALVYNNAAIGLTNRMITVNDVESEKQKAGAAIADTRTELEGILAKLDPERDKTMFDLIEIQIELAEDPMLGDKIYQYIEVSYHNAGDAVILASEDIARQFEGFENEYL